MVILYYQTKFLLFCKEDSNSNLLFSDRDFTNCYKIIFSGMKLLFLWEKKYFSLLPPNKIH